MAFSILRAPLYVDALLLQSALWGYWIHHHHPFHTLAKLSPSSLIGEDIELGNRLLSQHCSRDSRRTDPKLFGDAYAQLGILMHNGMSMNIDIGEMKKGLKGTRRHTISPDDFRVEEAERFLNSLLDSMEAGEHKH